MIKVAVLTMQKNESVILPYWVNYYSKIFGVENLFIYDNGSTFPDVLSYLNKIKSEGCNIISANERSDFQNKGDLLLSKAKSLFKSGYDFAYFADADEFLINVSEGVPRINKQDIWSKFSDLTHLESAITRVGVGWFNIPSTKKFYIDNFGTQKVILRSDISDSVVLDLGFHMYDWGSRCDLDVFGKFNPSDLGLLHFHNKPYADYVVSAKMKLEGRVDLNDKEALKKYNGAGSHLVAPLLNGERSYYDSFLGKEKSAIDFDAIVCDFDFEIPYLK